MVLFLVTLESIQYSVRARTETKDPQSPPLPYQVKLWVTIGSEADLNDPPRDLVTIESPQIGQESFIATVGTSFQLPTQGNPNPRNELDPEFDASSLVGNVIFIKVCVVPKELVRPICVVDKFEVHPDQPKFVESPSDMIEDQATIYWEQLPKDGTVSIGDGHRLNLVNQNDSRDRTLVYVPKVDDSELVDYNGVLRNRIVLKSETQLDASIPTFTPKAGQAYLVSLRACGQANSVCSTSRIIRNVTVFSSDFTASAGTSINAIEVNWVTHAPDTSRYLLKRCLVLDPSSCIEIDTGSSDTSFEDATAVPDLEYRYTVSACKSNGSCVPTGITNPGFLIAATPDPVPDPITFVSATDGVAAGVIFVNWTEFSPDPSLFNNPRYELLVANPTDSGSTVTLEIPYQANQSNTVVNTNNNPQLASGVKLDFSVRSCADTANSAAVCTSSTVQNSGYSLAAFQATSIFIDQADIEWVQFSPQTTRYRLERCTVTATPQCVFIDPIGNATSYTDSTSIADTSYVYTIFACTGSANSSCVETGETNVVTIANQNAPDPVSFVNATDGTVLNQINVNWSELMPAASDYDNPGYVVEIVNQNSLGDTLVREVDYQLNMPDDVFLTGTGQDLVSGVLYEFSVLTCEEYDSSSPQCVDPITSDLGHSLARFDASSPFAGAAQINWSSFSADTLRYRLERCTDSANPVCTFFEPQAAISYQDLSVVEGAAYQYSIYACRTPFDGECMKTGDTDVVTITASIQPDPFENDGSPFHLNNPNQTIVTSVSQTRNFHTMVDRDWTRLFFESGTREFDIRTTSDLESLDTQLTLFDADGELLGCALNTPSSVTGNARLRLPNLSAGEYFLRVEQQDNGSVINPVESYSLITTISTSSSGAAIEFPDCSVVDDFPRAPIGELVAPSIQLLLD